MDEYVQRFIEAIRNCNDTDDGLERVINKIYEDGWGDGYDEGEYDATHPDEEEAAWHNSRS
jgi:hypothetical protein